MTKQAHQQAAADEAAKLARIAMRLQRAQADQVLGLLKEADGCLVRYRLHKLHLAEKPSAIIDDTVAEDLEAPMNALAEVIRDTVKPHSFALLVFGADKIEGGRMNYVANAVRDDICIAMREFIAAHENRLLPEPEGKM